MAFKGEEDVVSGVSIKFKETFSMSGLYEMLRYALMEDGWTERSNSEKENFMETFYMERIDPGAGKEDWIYWRVYRDVNSFIKEKLNIDYHVLTMKDVEIVHKGQKIKAQKGEVEIFFTAKLIADYKGELGKSKFWSWFFEYFIKRIYRKQWERMKTDLRKDVYSIHSRIKQFLELKDWLKQQVPFQPGLPGTS